MWKILKTPFGSAPQGLVKNYGPPRPDKFAPHLPGGGGGGGDSMVEHMIHVVALSAVGHVVLEWCWKMICDFTEIVNDQKLMWETTCQIMQFIFGLY